MGKCGETRKLILLTKHLFEYLLIYHSMHQTQCHSVSDGYTQQRDYMRPNLSQTFLSIFQCSPFTEILLGSKNINCFFQFHLLLTFSSWYTGFYFQSLNENPCDLDRNCLHTLIGKRLPLQNLFKRLLSTVGLYLLYIVQFSVIYSAEGLFDLNFC